MSLSLQIDRPRSEATPALDRILAVAGRRRGLHESIAGRAETLTANYLRGIASERHRSAQKLGARPSGHLERAATNVTSEATAEAAAISITSPGISRVAGPVTIRPGAGKEFLTIPLHALSYGKRAKEVERRTGQRLFRPGPKASRKRVLAIVRDGRLVILFALVRQVTLPQDRTLLPSDDAYNQAAVAGVRDYVTSLVNRTATT